jgi:hypothetical protein
MFASLGKRCGRGYLHAPGRKGKLYLTRYYLNIAYFALLPQS